MKTYASMGSLEYTSIFTTKVILKSRFSSAGGLFLKNTGLRTKMEGVQIYKVFYELSKYQTI